MAKLETRTILLLRAFASWAGAADLRPDFPSAFGRIRRSVSDRHCQVG